MNNDLPAKRAQLSNLIDLAVEIQQISAPTFSEGPRGEFVRVLFQNEHLQDVSMDSLGNVFARLAGKQEKAKPLFVSAHLDTVFRTLHLSIAALPLIKLKCTIQIH